MTQETFSSDTPKKKRGGRGGIRFFHTRALALWLGRALLSSFKGCGLLSVLCCFSVRGGGGRNRTGLSFYACQSTQRRGTRIPRVLSTHALASATLSLDDRAFSFSLAMHAPFTGFGPGGFGWQELSLRATIDCRCTPRVLSTHALASASRFPSLFLSLAMHWAWRRWGKTVIRCFPKKGRGGGGVLTYVAPCAVLHSSLPTHPSR